MVWKDKRDFHIVTNMHQPPNSGNYCDEHGNAVKLAIVEDYNRNMDFVDKSDNVRQLPNMLL
jgi:hypothetical protein